MSIQIHDPKNIVDSLVRIYQASCIAGAARACLVITRDRAQAITLIRDAAGNAETSLYHFTVAARRRYVASKLSWESIGNGTPNIQDLLNSTAESSGGGIFIIEDCLSLLKDDGGDRPARMMLAEMLNPTSQKDGLVLVFVEPPESERHLPRLLADQIIRLEVPYPRASELEIIAREEVSAIAHKANVAIPLNEIRRKAPYLVDGLVSYTRSAARDALRDALGGAPADLDGAARMLMQRKVQKLSRELSMNVLDTSDCEGPIGLDYLVDYLNIQRQGMRVSGNKRARGILLVGPPGTGKTMLAKAIGKLVELPVVEFRISSLMNSLLGETESRFAQAFATLEAMSPNVVFIDEIEKAFGDSNERDGGTMMRCTGALLSWLSDNPYPNYIVATCNSLTRMGEIGQTMTRSERFDTAFFVDVPNTQSRQRMLTRWLTGNVTKPDLMAGMLLDSTDKFSGADLHSLVKQAIRKAEYQGEPLTAQHLMQEVERKRARTLALYDEFARLRQWGQLYCEPAGPTADGD